MTNEEAVISSVLFDRIIQVTLHWSDKKDDDSTDRTYSEYDIVIGANELGGIKTDISFSANLLPGDIFHEVTLTIKNLQLPYDIRRYKSMTILAGYRKQNGDQQFDELVIRRFPIEIFYSYCITPAPDSVTVFKGIIVSSFTDNYLHTYFTNDYTFNAYFYKNVTVIEYINSMIQLMNDAGYNIALSEKIPPSIKNILMNTGPDTPQSGEENTPLGKQYQYKGVVDIIKSISSMLDTAYRSLGKRGSFNVNIIDNTLVISCTDGFYTKDELVVVLDGISEASLNAGLLNVTAPWYPPLVPGDIIKVSRKFIDGSELPNIIDVDEQMGQDNMYRILTMSVEFASVGATNNMKITAIPLRYAEDNFTDTVVDGEKEYKTKFEAILSSANETLDKYKEKIKKKQNKDETVDKQTNREFYIHVGEVKEEENPVYTYVNEHLSFFRGILDKCKFEGPVLRETRESKICKGYYKDIEPLKLPEGKFSQAVSVNSDFFDYEPGYDSYWLWPILYAMTYAAYKSYPDTKDRFQQFPYTSDMVKAGKYVAVPSISSWSELKGNDYSGLYNAASELATVVGSKKKAMLKNIAAILKVM